MKYGTEIETERLILRNWTLNQQDKEFFHFIMSDEVVRRFYVTRLSREQSDDLLAQIVADHKSNGISWGTACLKENGQPIGFTGLSNVSYLKHPNPAVEIGWLYHPSHWGKGYATEAGKALLDHGFRDVGLKEIVAFAVFNNQPSIAVMQRIGMKQVAGGDFDHPNVPASHPHLKRHVLYKATNT